MSSITKRFISYLGKFTPDSVAAKHGASWKPAISNACVAEEKADPRVKYAHIKGDQPHTSHKDPNDPNKVISVQLLASPEDRLGTMHVHEDGTYTFKKSRFGKS